MKAYLCMAVMVCIGSLIFWSVYIPKTIYLLNEFDVLIKENERQQNELNMLGKQIKEDIKKVKSLILKYEIK